MTAANHVITGALIGTVATNPAIAVSAAFFSHFILDILPHFGDKNLSLKSLKFSIILLTDIALALLVLLSLMAVKPNGWYLMVVCAVAAVSPDILWFDDWLKARRNQSVKHGKVRSFLSWIQWCERPWGIYIEIVWFVAAIYAFISVIN